MARSILELIAAAHTHSVTEGSGDIDGILATMEENPVYEFFPLGRRFAGMQDTRRYYEHFVDHVRHRIVASEKIAEWVGDDGVILEYAMSIKEPDESAPHVHRILAVLTFGETRLTGERMFSDETLFRLLIGPLWEELEPIS